MKNLKIKNGLNNNFNSTPPPPPPPQCAVNEALTSLFCLLAFLFLYACSSSEPTPTTPITTTHKVTFNPNTPSASSATVSNLPAEQNVDEGNLATEPTAPPTLDGYTFGGWYTEASTTTVFLFSAKITKATTLYAKWTTRQTFTITYHANKPSNAPPEATVTGLPENPVSITEGQTATAPTPPTLTGYDFAEWYTETTATNPYDFSQVITANIDLYAKWNIQQFTITYHGNKPQDVTANVTGVPENPVNINYNQPATVPTPPTLANYNFVGWYTEEAATNQFNFSQVITANIDLYAKWSQDPVVTFDTQRGSTIESQTLTGTTKRATRPDDPAREDYTFDNWYTTADTGTTQFNFDQDITAQSTTVYARWNRIMRTVTYHGNKPDDAPSGVSVTKLPDPINVNSGDTATAPATPPELQDYVFQGWFVGTTTGTILRLENTAFAFETTVIKEDLLLYAKWTRTQITVTFHGRKPSTAPTDATITGLITDPTIVAVNSGDRTTAPIPAPELTGYTLDGWYKATSSATGTVTLENTAFDFSLPVRGENINLYTKWLQQFTVTYHGNKPSDAPEGVTVTGVPENPVSIPEGQTATVPTAPELTGYNFVAWYTEATATNQFDFSQGITTSIDLYAKWTQDPVVTFDTRGGSAIEPQRLTETPKRATRPQENPTREDYTFENWYTTAETGTTQFNFDQDITAQSTIVYARWNRITRTVTYHGNIPDTVPRGVSVTSLPDPATVNVNSGDTATAPATPPELQDYVFQDWFAGTITGTLLRLENTAFAFETTAIKENKNLYAKWTRKKITITFYGNKPSTAPEGATITGLMPNPKPVTINSGETTTALKPPPELTGYTLDGWFIGTTSEGTLALQDTAFDFTTTTIRGENINLYAKWTKDPVVTFETQGGSNIMSQTITRPTTRATRPDEPARVGYAFDNWYTMATGGTLFDFTTPISSSLTVYAHWIQQFTVTYHANKPSDAPQDAAVTGVSTTPVTVNSGDRITTPTDPTQANYNFVGWYTEEATTNQFNFSQVITTNIDLYAKWSALQTFTVSYNANKPTSAIDNVMGVPTDVKVIINLATTEPSPEPTLVGYTFEGWYTEATATNKFDFSTNTIIENIILYAKWTIQVFTVTYDTYKPSGATADVTGPPNPVMINYNLRTAEPNPKPTLVGYTFEGWYTEQATTTKFVFTTPITEDKTLYAKWVFRPSTRDALVAEINRAITPTTPSPNLNYIDTSLITVMSELFKDKSSFNGDISSWNVSKVNHMNNMFSGASAFNGNISSWNVSLVENMSDMFYRATAFNQNISNWNVSLVKNMSYMFNGAFVFNGNISSWNVAMVTNMSNMFSDVRSFNQNISSWNVAKVTDMSSMFASNAAFNQNISSWNVAKVTNMSYMFNYANAFNGDISNWRPTALTNMSYMFNNAYAFTQNINSWNIASSVDKTDAFYNSGLAENLPSWATP